MTNKMPVVGKKYRNKEDKTNIIVKSIKDDWVVTKGFCKIHKESIFDTLCYISNFWDWFEELSDFNWQETEECCPIETAEAAWNMSEVSEVERALKELKYHAQIEHYFDKEAALEHIKTASRNLIKALEVEKNEPTITFQTPDQPELGCNSPTWSDVSKQEPKIKTGTITASDVSKAWEDFDKKIKAATWVDGKARNLVNALEDGKIKSGRGIAEYTPSDFMKHMERCEDALKNMPKQEPKIDMKEECVEPVSIWKDMTGLNKEKGLELILATKGEATTIEFLSYDFKSQNYFDYFNDVAILSYYEKYITLTDFVNQVEDMEARLRKLEGK